jgi:uncharacterized repeat protein (TIGR03837 family)
MPSNRKHWDIFCSVIDNYGDVGVAWRLSRQLAGEHGIAVRLFVDDQRALQRIAPEGMPGIEVRPWHGASGDFSDASATSVDAVVEAFGCGLPPAYLDRMGPQAAPPLWINLEYLSAEQWIEDSHGLASRHPQRPLTRHFWFPGFTARTGGLLRERDLFTRRDAFREDRLARGAFWASLRLDAPPPGSLAVSLFCYPNLALASLLDAWAAGRRPIACIVPEGVAQAEIEAWAGSPLRPGQSLRRGNLGIARIPFLPQDDYDRLLWACDLNFVRGEDSFVRAQWAAAPLVWQAYPQTGDAHLAKLAAFMSRYCADLAPGAATAQAGFTTAWNRGAALSPADWEAFAAALPALATHAQRWAKALAAVPDLATGLVEFAENKV